MTNLVCSFFSFFVFVYIIQSRLFGTQIFFHIIVRAFFLIFQCCKQHLRQISGKASLLDFTLSKLCPVIPQFSQKRPGHRCFPSFFEYFFYIYVGRISLSTQLSFLAGTSRLVLTCYKTYSSQDGSEDGSKNHATLKKGLFPTKFNGQKIFTIVFTSLKLIQM